MTDNSNEEFIVQQEIIDKTNTKNVDECREYSEDNPEDNCLQNCLLTRFEDRFKCMHARLKLMDLNNKTLQDKKPCLLENFEPELKDLSESKKPCCLARLHPEESGLREIKKIIASFHMNNMTLRYVITVLQI